jgi:hypothetical protein
MNYDDNLEWFPLAHPHLPYMSKILDVTDDTMVFSGTFILEPEILPIEALLEKNGKLYCCLIIHKEVLDIEDTPRDPFEGAFYDEDVGGYIRLSPPDETIEIKYKILRELGKTSEDDAFFERATDRHTVLDRNEVYRLARKERERKEEYTKWERDNPELAARLMAARKEPADSTHKNGIQS